MYEGHHFHKTMSIIVIRGREEESGSTGLDLNSCCW